MKRIWSPQTASLAYLDTVNTCKLFRQSGEAEFIAAMAGGWNAKLIVEFRSNGCPNYNTSLGLAVAARHTSGRHVCVVPDERSRLEFSQSTRDVGVSPPEMVVGEAEEVVVEGVDFLVVDCKRKDFARVLRFTKLSNRGAVIVCVNASQRNLSAVSWHGALDRGTRVIRSVYLPVGGGLDVAHVANTGQSGNSNRKGCHHRWIKHIDHESGEEHVFRR